METKELKEFTIELKDKLLEVHEDDTHKYKYPRTNNYESAIYDLDKKLIFSTFDNRMKTLDKDFFIKDDKAYYISTLKPHYLGAAYIVVQKQMKPLNILSDIIAIALVVVFITIITSFFLVKIVLKPMRDTLHLLDNFIKDTTHELNTPITTILANIETINSDNCDEKSLRKLERIKIASMSISNLYEDLVYLLLNHKTSSLNEELNISDILKQRVIYFTLMANAKKLDFSLEIEKNVKFTADRQKFERLIDNIISNAIKYTKVSTTINIQLTNSNLSITDQGKGMSEKEIENIYEKYVRFDKVQGGFGIGYSIIKSITDEYKIDINIESKINEGTKVTLSW